MFGKIIREGLLGKNETGGKKGWNKEGDGEVEIGAKR